MKTDNMFYILKNVDVVVRENIDMVETCCKYIKWFPLLSINLIKFCTQTDRLVFRYFNCLLIHTTLFTL